MLVLHEVLDLLVQMEVQELQEVLVQLVLQDHLDKMAVLAVLHLHIVIIQINQRMIQAQVN